MKLYHLTSREGEKVAELCEFSNGKVAVSWQRNGYPGSTVVWDSLDDAKLIHVGVGSWSLRGLFAIQEDVG